MATNRKFYAGHSYMGVNFTYDSPCWIAYAFQSKRDRDQWLSEHEYSPEGNLVAEPITYRESKGIRTRIDAYFLSDWDGGPYSWAYERSQ